MLQKNTLITICVSSVISAFTAVSSVQLLLALSGAPKAPDNASANNNVPVAEKTADHKKELKYYNELANLDRRFSALESQLQQQTLELNEIANNTDEQSRRLSQVEDESLVNLVDEQSELDEDQFLLQDQQVQQDFEDKNILFELEDYNENSSSQLELAMDSISNDSATFGLQGLEIQEQECRGQSCRVQFNYSGDESALSFLPVLLANKGHDSIQISQTDSEHGVSIVALMQ